jgi:ABC-type antimicrobial peptide transport system permease subunit
VAACSLTVGMLAGVIERRRPFALLRASGLRLGELRQVVFLETAAAMLVTAAVGVGLGLASSYAFALFGDMTWTWPDVGVFAMVGIGVLAALLLSTMALPLLDAATRYEAVRYE